MIDAIEIRRRLALNNSKGFRVTQGRPEAFPEVTVT
jgi:hypothetical protein